MASTWAWRLPSALQGLFSIMCLALLPLVPESPRWLQDQGRSEAALLALAQTYSNGEIDDSVVIVQYREIADTLGYEKALNCQKSPKQIAQNPSSRKRILLVTSVAVFCMLSGNNVISYYLGTMLTQAGITDSTTQLEINIILNAFCLVVSVVGTGCADKLGRKPLAAISPAA
jgi:MFS family permease